MKNILFLLLFFVSVSNHAQKIFKDYSFVNIKEGVPKVGVSSIVQDHKGFIWIATTGTGLYKFDGIKYTSYKFNFRDTNSLSNNLVQSAFIDSKKRLWIGTENGLNLYDRDFDQFKRILLDNKVGLKESVLALEEDSYGNLLIGTDNTGLYKLNINTFKTDKILNDSSRFLNVYNIKHTRQGKTFVGTNLGLKEVDLIHNKLIHTKLFTDDEKSIDSEIENLFIDNKDNLWIGFEREKGVYKCALTNDINNNIVSVKKLGITSKKVMKIVQLPDNTMMIGSENDGLFHLDEEGGIIKNYVSSNTGDNSILHNSIWELFIDKNDRIWLGYFNSGIAVSDKLYDKFKDLKSLPNNKNSSTIPSVSSVIKGKSGNLWISTDGGGIDVYNPKTSKVIHINKKSNAVYSGLNSDYIVNLFLDSQNNLWVASWDKGIFLLKSGSKHFINFNKKSTPKEFNINTVRSFSEDSKGNIWIAAYFEGLYSYNLTTHKFKKHDSEEFLKHQSLNNKLMKVFVSSDDIIWVGTAYGLFKIKEVGNEKFEIISFSKRMQKEYGGFSDVNHILSIFPQLY